MQFGERNPEFIIPRPDSPNSSTHSETRGRAIQKANREFGHDALYLELSDSSASSTFGESSTEDSTTIASNSSSRESLVDFDGALVGVRTVSGGTSIFRALIELEQYQVQDTDIDWYKITKPIATKTGKSTKTGDFLLGYSTVDSPVFEYADKLITRNVGLQVWPQQSSISIQTGQQPETNSDQDDQIDDESGPFSGPSVTIPVEKLQSRRKDEYHAAVELQK